MLSEGIVVSVMYLIIFTCKVLLEVIFHENWCHLYITFDFDMEIIPQTKKGSKEHVICILCSIRISLFVLGFALIALILGICKGEKKRQLAKNLLLVN